jgi:hypothetical protein
MKMSMGKSVPLPFSRRCKRFFEQETEGFLAGSLFSLWPPVQNSGRPWKSWGPKCREIFGKEVIKMDLRVRNFDGLTAHA